MFVYHVSLVLGIFLVSLSNNWICIWISIELVTLALVVLMSGQLTPRGVEAIAKYFILQALASAFLLIGISYRYYSLGSVSFFSSYNEVSYVFILMGLMIKIAVFPNPFWFIDVVGGLSLFRSVYVVVLSKFIPLYLYGCLISNKFVICVLLIGVVTIFLATVAGTNQTSLRKVIAYSSIAHLGWMLVGFPFLGSFVCLFIFFSYVLMISPLFYLGGSNSVNFLIKAKNLYYNPLFVFSFMLSLLSLAGFPPLLGFFYKWIIFYGLVSGGAYLSAGCLILFSLLSLYFYLQICYSLYTIYWPVGKISFWGSKLTSTWLEVVSGSLVVVVSGMFVVFAVVVLGPVSSAWFI
uniref:NADH-ubiquinone oxidoreductase chain 2 n=1 Tax=Ophionereis sp. TaxID=3135531 RepID=A0AAU6PX08_9ECHI